MIRIHRTLIAGLIVWGTVVQGNHIFGNDIEYTITDLGTLGGPTSVPTCISQNGIIVGNSMPNVSSNHPFVYQGNGPMQDIGLLDPINGTTSDATSVNSKGQVVGYGNAAAGNGSDTTHAFYWGGSGSPVDLGTLGGQQSFAMAINESGQIGGYASTTSGALDGASGPSAGGPSTWAPGFLATAINNEGLLGGISQPAGHAALYNLSSGSITDLGAIVGGTLSQVNGMSAENGFVVGFDNSNGFLYDVNTGVLTNLVNPASPSWALNALGVNSLGDAVGGYSLDATGGDGVSFIYTPTGGIQNLNDLIDPSSGWNLDGGASAINDAGQIVGCGINPQGEFHAFLLTPVVPEPSSLSLLCGAIAGLIVIRSGAGRSRLSFFGANVFAHCNARNRLRWNAQKGTQCKGRTSHRRLRNMRPRDASTRQRYRVHHHRPRDPWRADERRHCDQPKRHRRR